jgi:exodeoxyribonuclease V alpha subunit
MSSPAHQDPETTQAIAGLRALAEAGVLRRLDAEFAAFMGQLDPNAGPGLAIAAAVLCHREGQGHTCLPLSDLMQTDPILWGPPPSHAHLLAVRRASPGTLSQWVAELVRSPLVARASSGGALDTPLVLAGPDEAPRLYLRRDWRDERTVEREVAARSLIRDPVDEGQVRQVLDQLFGEAPADSDTVDWQRVACALAVRGRLSLMTGGPGTGKTYTAARLLALLFAVEVNPSRLRIALAAPTGKAAARLRDSIDESLQALQPGQACPAVDLSALQHAIGPARTLHALLGSRPDSRRFRHHAGEPLDLDVLIVDEASMVPLEMMAALLDALPPTARLILLGDKDQLASVEAGAVLGDLCRDAHIPRYDRDTVRYLTATTGQSVGTVAPTEGLSGSAIASIASQTVMLTKTRRFGGPIGALAQAINQVGDAAQAATLLRTESQGALWVRDDGTLGAAIELAVKGREGALACYSTYLMGLQAQPVPRERAAHAHWVRGVLTAFERFRVLCAVREGDWGTEGLNRAIERALGQAGLIKPDGVWYPGRPILVTRNDPSLGVFNGDVGIVLPGPDESARLRAYFPEGAGSRSVSVSRLLHVETAFAMTVHKSQGSEFEHTLLVLAPKSGAVLTRELLYTAVTRARKAFSLVAAHPDLLRSGIERPTRRAGGLLTPTSPPAAQSPTPDRAPGSC